MADVIHLKETVAVQIAAAIGAHKTNQPVDRLTVSHGLTVSDGIQVPKGWDYVLRRNFRQLP